MLFTFSTQGKTPDAQKLVFGLIVTVFLAAGLSLNFIQPGRIHTDGGIFSSIAYKLLHGGTLYVDAWENKPPAIFYLIELFMAVVPDPIYAVFILSFTSLVFLAILLFHYSFSSLKSLSLALILTSLALYFVINKLVVGDGLYTELYGTICLLLGLSLHKAFLQTKKKWLLALGYISLGTAFWFKEPFILMTLICAAIVYQQSGRIFNFWKSLGFILVPSAIFILLLAFQGSLLPLFKMISYNFSYVGGETQTSLKTKINELYTGLIVHLSPILLLSAYQIIKAVSNKTNRGEALFKLALLLSSCVHIVLSPYNFGHYYFPVYVFIFVFVADAYELMKETSVNYKFPLIILSVYTIYMFDDSFRYSRTYRIDKYVPDKIVSALRQHPDKTLFVDYVNRSDLYLKARKVPVTFVPVALPVHFQENETGLKNRERIYAELEKYKPDYVVTTFTTAYFSWFMPNSPYYENNYDKVDSIQPGDENILILWKRKENH